MGLLSLGELGLEGIFIRLGRANILGLVRSRRGSSCSLSHFGLKEKRMEGGKELENGNNNKRKEEERRMTKYKRRQRERREFPGVGGWKGKRVQRKKKSHSNGEGWW